MNSSLIGISGTLCVSSNGELLSGRMHYLSGNGVFKRAINKNKEMKARKLLAAMAAAAVIIFCSCNKDEDNNTFSLVGTTWVSDVASAQAVYDGAETTYSPSWEITFVSDTTYTGIAKVTMVDNATGEVSPDNQAGSGTYRFDGSVGYFEGSQAFYYHADSKTLTTHYYSDGPVFSTFFPEGADFTYTQKQ